MPMPPRSEHVVAGRSAPPDRGAGARLLRLRGAARRWREPLPGDLIGGYRVEARLGEGGHGVVYQARDPQTGLSVAIKVLHASEDPRQEARLTNKVEHPGIVRVLRVDRLRGRPFLVMDLLHGETLRARLRREPLITSREALRFTRQLAEALQAAHDAGIVHRDLKPENVMLVRDDEVEGGRRTKILDFGIARQTTSPAGEAERYLIGTRAYMAPERFAQDGLMGPGVDVWALGVLLYEMLAGKPPFEGESTTELRGKIQYESQALLDLEPFDRRQLLRFSTTTIITHCMRSDAS